MVRALAVRLKMRFDEDRILIRVDDLDIEMFVQRITVVVCTVLEYDRGFTDSFRFKICFRYEIVVDPSVRNPLIIISGFGDDVFVCGIQIPLVNRGTAFQSDRFPVPHDIRVISGIIVISAGDRVDDFLLTSAGYNINGEGIRFKRGGVRHDFRIRDILDGAVIRLVQQGEGISAQLTGFRQCKPDTDLLPVRGFQLLTVFIAEGNINSDS